MSRTFTKLFSSITESTVWCEPDRTRLVWICMLAMADSRGRVWGSIPGLANRARVPIDDARIAIATFLAPDPDSRTPDNEGRRVEVIDGGWRLLNHEKYRAIRDEESTKEAKRKYINARRASERKALNAVPQASMPPAIYSRSTVSTVDHRRDNAEAEAEAEAEEELKTNPKTTPTPSGKMGGVGSGKVIKFPPGFEVFWAAYPKKVSKDAACRAFAKLKPDPAMLASMVSAIAVQRESEQWRKESGQFIPYPATWLHDGRWMDEVSAVPGDLADMFRRGSA